MEPLEISTQCYVTAILTKHYVKKRFCLFKSYSYFQLNEFELICIGREYESIIFVREIS